MSIVYVDQQGATVRKNGGQLLVVVKGKQPYAIPMNEIEQLVLQGNVQLTTQAAVALLRADARVVFTDRHGGLAPAHRRKAAVRQRSLPHATLQAIYRQSRRSRSPRVTSTTTSCPSTIGVGRSHSPL